MAMTKQQIINANWEKHLTATKLFIEETGYQFAEEKKEPSTKAKKLSAKAQEAEDFINMGNPFGCNKSAVAKLCSILLGERISVKHNDDDDDNDEMSDSLASQGIRSLSNDISCNVLFIDNDKRERLGTGNNDTRVYIRYLDRNYTDDIGLEYLRPMTEQEMKSYLTKKYGVYKTIPTKKATIKKKATTKKKTVKKS